MADYYSNFDSIHRFYVIESLEYWLYFHGFHQLITIRE